MAWELLYNHSRKTFEDWGIYDAVRRVTNQGNDRVRFKTKGQQFLPDQTLVIYKDQTPWFQGRITQVPCLYAPEVEENFYEIAGTWWYLEHIVYQQNWRYSDGSPKENLILFPRGVCILGQSDAGKALNAKECIQSLLQYAIKHNVPMQVGHIEGFDFYFPYESVKDCSCAEALQRILRWAPDAICWTDYASTPPTFNIVRQSFLTARDIRLSQAQRLHVVPRYDLRVNSVMLKYEHTHSNGQVTWKTNTIDKYPANANGEEFNALVLTIELEGNRSHLQEQVVKVSPIETNSIEWWKRHCPILQAVPNDNIHLFDIQRESNLTNELIEGAIAPWMNCEARYETICAHVNYTSAFSVIKNRLISLRMCTTNAVSKTYRHSTFVKGGTVPPSGLAKVLFDAVSTLQYEGSVQIQSREIGPSYMGTRINFTEASAELEHINAVVQEECCHLDTGTVDLRFGAPKHLGPNDLIQLMRSNRLRTTSTNPEVRFDVNAGTAQTITYFPTHTPLTHAGNDQGQFSKFVVSDGNKQIELDTSALPENVQICMRPYDIIESGVLKKAWILSS